MLTSDALDFHSKQDHGDSVESPRMEEVEGSRSSEVAVPGRGCARTDVLLFVPLSQVAAAIANDSANR